MLFYTLLALSLEPRARVSRVYLREPLLTLLRAPYRYKLSRHQITLARQRLVLELPLSGSRLSGLWGSALLTPAWARLCWSGRSSEWLD